MQPHVLRSPLNRVGVIFAKSREKKLRSYLTTLPLLLNHDDRMLDQAFGAGTYYLLLNAYRAVSGASLVADYQ